jgi:predicted nucleic acid-binding protein
MHDNIVLDSSVIAAAFFPEKITGKAIEVIEDNNCITVDLAFSEVTNVAWKRVAHSDFSVETVKSSFEDCIAFIRESCEVIPSQDLVIPAWDLACHYGITAYNAVFVAASIQCDAPLITADRKLHTAMNNNCNIRLIH